MKIGIVKVQAYNRDSIPEDNVTIADDLDLDKLCPNIKSVEYYLRSKEDCPLGRGNWMLDITLKQGSLVAYKYPIEMLEEKFVKFIQPLLARVLSMDH